jgi:hypothetical protein
VGGRKGERSAKIAHFIGIFPGSFLFLERRGMERKYK